MTTQSRQQAANAHKPTMGLRLLAVFMVLLLGACSALPERIDPSMRADQEEARALEREQQGGGEDDIIFSEGEPSPDAFQGSERFPGTGTFINQEAVGPRADPPSEDGEITLNFEGQGIQEVVHAILHELLQVNYIISPGVSGQVTFSTARPVGRDQIMPILEMLLRWNGATLIWREGKYHVVPIGEAVRGNLVPRLDSAGQAQGYEVMAVPLEYLSPAKMAELLQPYAREDGIFNADNARGLLFVAGTRYELQNYLQIIDSFDVDWLAGMSVGMFSLDRIEVGELLPELE
ncbi:MAG TPA: secretin N-terminal domain-containing protein, partial [Wenzhouxiangella sp.]